MERKTNNVKIISRDTSDKGTSYLLNTVSTSLVAEKKKKRYKEKSVLLNNFSTNTEQKKGHIHSPSKNIKTKYQINFQ